MDDAGNTPSGSRRRSILMWAIVAVLMTLFACVLGWVSYEEYQSDKENEFHALELQSRLGAVQIENSLRSLDLVLQTVITDETLEPKPSDSYVQQRRRFYLRQFPEAEALFVINANGLVTSIASLNTPELVPQLLNRDVSKREYFLQHKNAPSDDTGSYKLSRPFKGVSGRYLIAMTRAIRGPGGELRGVVSVSVAPRFFERILRESFIERTTDAAAIHNKEGDIIFRLPEPESFIGNNIATSTAIQEFRNSASTVYRYQGITTTDGEQRLLVLSKVGQTELDIGVAEKYEKMMAPWRRSLYFKTLIFVFVSVLLILLVREAQKRLNIREQRAQLNRRFQAYFESSMVGMATIGPDGSWIDINPALCEILGYTEGQLRSNSWPAIASAEDVPSLSAGFEMLRTGQINETHSEHTLINHDGQKIVVEVAVRAVRSKNDSLEYIVVLVENISARKSAESALIRARDEALEANMAKSRFLTTMSHEIRTPLNGILGMAQLLRTDDLAQQKRIEYASVISNSGKTLLTLLNDVIEFSKIETDMITLESIQFEPQQLLDEMRELYRSSLMQKGLDFEINSNLENGLRLTGDPNRLRQMLSNLINNSVKFTDAGMVRLEAHLISEYVGEGRCLIEFAVTDTGAGIDKVEQAQLFQPFRQADSSTTRVHGGAGLGLSLVRSLTSLMGGSIGVQSEPGAGTRFWIRLPFQKVAPLLPDEPDVSNTEPFGQARTAKVQEIYPERFVLVAEDNHINRLVMEAFLKQLGVRCVQVENGKQALDLVASEITPSLILMDFQMPVMDGLQATREIRKWEMEHARSQIPIIALTASAFDEDRGLCLQAGMNDFVGKPLDLAQLRALLQKWLPQN